MDTQNVESAGTGTMALQPAATGAMTEVVDQGKDPYPVNMEKGHTADRSDFLCFLAGTVDGNTPLVSPVKLVKPEIERECGTPYTVGNWVGTAAGLATGVGEAKAIVKGAWAGAKALGLAGKVKRIATAGLRAGGAVVRSTWKERVADGRIVRTVGLQVAKNGVDEGLRTLIHE